jgi:hypothetical protein
MNGMVAHARKTETGFVIELSFEAARSLHIVDGSAVTVLPVPESGEAEDGTMRYASTEEALKAFEATLPQHEAAYRKLAK